MSRATRVAAAVVLTAMALIVPASSTSAQTPPTTSPTSNGDDFSVSLPSEPVVMVPGQTYETSLRVANRAPTAGVFHISGVVLEALDEGKVQVADGTDAWVQSVQAPANVQVDAGTYVEVPVKFTAPANAPVDIHLVGFVVQPVRASSGNTVDVRTQAISFIAVEIQGNAQRSVVIRPHRMPRFVFSDKLKGSFEVYNNGQAGVRFRAQAFINSSISGDNLGVAQASDRTSAQLLPAGRKKTLQYEWKSTQSFAIVRSNIEVGFVDGANGSKAVKQRGPIVVIVKPAFAIIAGSLLGIIVLIAMGFAGKRFVKRRKKRSARSKPAETT